MTGVVAGNVENGWRIVVRTVRVSLSRVWGLWSENGTLPATGGSSGGNMALHGLSEGRQWWMVSSRWVSLSGRKENERDREKGEQQWCMASSHFVKFT